MNVILTAAVWRALRAVIAGWIASTYAHNIWYAPVILAVAKALRDKYPGKFEWLPV